MISTNAIRAFSDKIRASQGVRQPGIQLSSQEAKNLNAEIHTLLALLVQLQANQQQPNEISVEVRADGF